ncbi:MAG TPA: GreA/GreB family elongation factor, partial [Rhodanobacteraceae bacterium]|nr:GreA/GreB family elongation factor [Rhodanobacteraceae bacterium]
GAVFFGATIEIENTDSGKTHTWRIVGPDETDAKKGWISVDSPLARAALKKRVDDEFEADLPGGKARFVVIAVKYVAGNPPLPPGEGKG